MMPRLNVSGSVADVDATDAGEKAEHLQQPEDHNDDNNDVQDVLYLPVHGNVIVDGPEEDADDDEKNDELNERHLVSYL